MGSLKLSEIAKIFNGELIGDDIEIENAMGLEDAQSNSITFIGSQKAVKKFTDSKAGAVIIGDDLEAEICIPVIKAKNPAVAFALTSQRLAPTVPHPANEIHPSASIADDATIGNNVTIAANTVIDSAAKIGDNTIIYPGVYIGKNVTVGKDCIIYANATIYYDCKIGDKCIIHSGVIIGADGFGFQWDGNEHLKIPQIGNVILGNNIEIGANTTIDRGRFSPTIIEDGCKLDNLVHIAHNCRIGENSVFAGHVGVSGSVDIGKGVVVGGQVGFADHIKVADGCHFYAKSGVASDIPTGGIYAGQPARGLKEAAREYHNVRSIGNMKSTIKELTKRIEELEK